MSEKYTRNIEVGETSPSESHEKLEVKHEGHERSHAETDQAEKLSAARQEVTKESAEKDQLLNKLNVEQEPEKEDVVSRPIDSDLKKTTFDKEIKHIRRKLTKTDRIGSQVIHQPIVRAISEVSSKTITRPSGLLGGGIVAFLGTSIYLYLTKYIGLKYNYSIFLFLLVAGFALGLVLEAIFRLTKSRKSI